VLMIC